MMKNTKNKALEALHGFGKRVVDNTGGLVKQAKYEMGKKGQQRTYEAYKMVNDADKAGVKDKGNESDPLFRARAMMKAAQRKALEKKQV